MKRWSKFLALLVVAAAFSSAGAGSYEDFFKAVEVDDAASVRALLQRGFDPNTRDPNGQVGLFLALRSESPKVAEALVSHPSIEVDAANPALETPLMIAALRGRADWCKRLVALGAKLHRDGWTPLHYAAAGPDGALVGWLIEQRAPIDSRSPNGTTPLMMSAGYGSEAGADELLERGADASLRNTKGMNAADFARAVGRDSLAAKLERAAAR